MLSTGQCQPGVYNFIFSAADRDGFVGHGDGALQIEVLQGWMETYSLDREGNCSSFLDPRTEGSASVRADVAQVLKLPVGRVRVLWCEIDSRRARQLGDRAVRLGVEVVRAHGDGGPLRPELYGTRLRRSALETHPFAGGYYSIGNVSEFEFVNAEPEGADPDGAWARNARVENIAVAADDLSARMGNATLPLALTEQFVKDETRADVPGGVAASVRSAFSAGTDESLKMQAMHSSTADEIARLDSSALMENSTSLLASIANNTLRAQEQTDELEATLAKAINAVSNVQGDANDNSPACRFGPRGGRLAYYQIGLRNETARPERRSSATEQDKEAPRNRRRGPRRMLEDSAAQPAFMSGYDTSGALETEGRYVEYGGYTRPRMLGANGRLRIIGGVLITQRRSKVKAGCAERNKIGRESVSRTSRFEGLTRGMRCSTARDDAYGYDPVFARLDLPPGIVDPTGGTRPAGLYDPAMRGALDAFYNESELAAPNTPYAFFRRDFEDGRADVMGRANVERALFDVYLDGVLMEDRAPRTQPEREAAMAPLAAAKLLLSYLYNGRFVDGYTRTLDVRSLIHNVNARTLVDVRVVMELNSQGEISSKTSSYTLPLRDYLDGEPGHVSLFAAELLVAAFAVILCVNAALNAGEVSRPTPWPTPHAKQRRGRVCARARDDKGTELFEDPAEGEADIWDSDVFGVAVRVLWAAVLGGAVYALATLADPVLKVIAFWAK